jgi:glutamate dehydrogenase
MRINKSIINTILACTKKHLPPKQLKLAKEFIKNYYFDLSVIEQKTLTDHRLWRTKLCSKLKKNLIAKYLVAFPSSYCEIYSVDEALADIHKIEALSKDNLLEINLTQEKHSQKKSLRLKLFYYNKPITLSDIFPILDNLGLKIINVRDYTIKPKNCPIVEFSDFQVKLKQNVNISIDNIYHTFCETFRKILLGEVENDNFNRLVILAKLDWRAVMFFRAYAKYLHQIRFGISQDYLALALINNSTITKLIFELFDNKFNPKIKVKRSIKNKILEDKINLLLHNISSFEEDKVLWQFIALINATVRTNFYQHKNYLAFKFSSKMIPELPLPHPLCEVFVYSSNFEGIHLRMAKIARGGIRWSDRREDFRTEILGLMKAQQVKNVIIVPYGAKGGFVLKNTPVTEVINCYRQFISALLDVTDNIVKNKIVSPVNTICYDDNDPYLVVAADKGTANFSNIANELSYQYNFWLKDAFASGGKTGYSHKAIGITARGAWESVKHHFSSMGMDINKNTFSVIGIGDMGGDVFGNGMLLSPNIKLIGAFNHKHIFLDPNPDSAVSFKERQKLFYAKTPSWDNYNKELISSGGGVYARNLKSIELSQEAQEVLKIKHNVISPSDLIKALLKAPVDLFWSGGIGTFVKATSESNADVNDISNDLIRINANELRCKIITEGANLGLTQLARVEYAMHGGLINTDFIDNSGGVDCSDHEVNIKILLNELVSNNVISENKRNKLLRAMTAEISQLVLDNNYSQTRTISLITKNSHNLIDSFIDCMERWEQIGKLNRKLEFLPSNKNLLERKANKIGLTRPEVAVLLAYGKLILKGSLLKQEFIKQPYFYKYFELAFPKSLKVIFKKYHSHHRLQQEIICTQLSNDFITNLGITFIQQIQNEMLVSLEDIICAFVITSELFNVSGLTKEIKAFDNKIPIKLQEELSYNLHISIKQAIRWFLRNCKTQMDISSIIIKYSKIISLIKNKLSMLIKEQSEDLSPCAMTAQLANDITSIKYIVKILNITDVALINNQDILKTTKIYFSLLNNLSINWLSAQIDNCLITNSWSILAKNALQNDLDTLQRILAISVSKYYNKNRDSEKIIQMWLENKNAFVKRWQLVINEIRKANVLEFNILYVAVKELFNIVNRLG